MNVTSHTHQVFYERAKISATSEESYLNFWKLGKNYWKQIFDGNMQRYGKWVFDEGLHGGPIEEGYLGGIHQSCHYASTRHINQKNIIKFYKKINRLACAHFEGTTESQTLLKGSETGQFRWIKKELKTATELNYLNLPKKTNIKAKIKKINEQIEKFSKELDLESPLVVVKKSSKLIVVHYSFQDIDKISKKIFENFYQSIEKATTEEEKIICIAKLFQLLEWLHPFPDGQGRTDLILLAKILCDYGLNPPILENPYISTFCLLEEWIEYLKNGVEQWKKEVLQQDAKIKKRKEKTIDSIVKNILEKYEKRKQFYKEGTLYHDGKPFYEPKYLEKIRVRLDVVENCVIASKNAEEKLFAIKNIIKLGAEVPDLLPNNELRKRIRRLAKISPENFDKKSLKTLAKAKAADEIIARPSIDFIIQKHLTRYQDHSKSASTKSLDHFYTKEYVEEVKKGLYFVEQWALSFINTREKSLKLKELSEKLITTIPPLLPYEEAIKKSKGIAELIPMDAIKQEALNTIKDIQSGNYKKKNTKIK